MNKIPKRFYHPGYGNFNNKKLCLPLCPTNNIIKYEKVQNFTQLGTI